MAELVPPSDAATALLRMPKDERLPKFKPNSMTASQDVPDHVKDAIRKIGSKDG